MTHNDLDRQIRRVLEVMRSYRENEYASGSKVRRYAQEIEEALEEYETTHKSKTRD